MLRGRGPLIAFSQQPSVAEFMKRILEDAGYDAVACWSTVDDLERVIQERDPAVVVYEVGLPFASELNRFREIQRRPAFAHRSFVIATPAPRDLCHRCGVTRTLEIFMRPTPCDVAAALDFAITAPPATDAA